MAVVDLHGSLDGSRPGLVLLHPVGLDHSFWGPLVPSASRSHRVLSLDLRGHGRSPVATQGLQVEDYVDDVRAARHSLVPAVVLGLSFGGMIAQLLAIHHPDDVAGLVCAAARGASLPRHAPCCVSAGWRPSAAG